MRPLLLDLCCCSGGAAMGYHRAGLDILGIDIVARPRFPFPFVRADALDALRHLLGLIHLPELAEAIAGRPVAALHESWPCQERSTLTRGTNKANGWGGAHEQLVPLGRELSEATGLPFIIEQPSNHGGLIRTDLTLCTDMFEVGPPPWVQRHRDFELHGFAAEQPEHPAGPIRGHKGYVRGYRGKQGDRPGFFRDGPYVAAYGDGGGKATPAEMQHALGIHWTGVREELTEAIPPVYTQHIGQALMDHLDEQAGEREARRTGGTFALHYLGEKVAA